MSNTEDSYKNDFFSNCSTHSINIFKQYNILPLNKLVVNRIGLMMYKHANNALPPAINDLYIENCEVHNYRNIYFMSIRVILIYTQNVF